MKIHLAVRSFLVLLALLLALPASAAVPRAISRLPYKITKPGRYVVTKPMVYTSITPLAAITIEADNVSLDLGGWTMESSHSVSNGSETTAVFASGRQNIKIFNGTIRSFFRAIFLEGTAGGNHLVEDILADDCTFLGIQVKGDSSIVQNCRVTNVDGSFTTERYGIHVTGTSAQVINNLVSGLITPAGTGSRSYGIYVENSESVLVAGNRVMNKPTTASLDNMRAITLRSCSYSVIAGNFASGCRIGLSSVQSPGSPATTINNNIFRDNTWATSSYFELSGDNAEGPHNFPTVSAN